METPFVENKKQKQCLLAFYGCEIITMITYHLFKSLRRVIYFLDSMRVSESKYAQNEGESEGRVHSGTDSSL